MEQEEITQNGKYGGFFDGWDTAIMYDLARVVPTSDVTVKRTFLEHDIPDEAPPTRYT